jgi:GWxTD domain-containing protein
MEHYCRVAEANLFFSEPRKGIEGWKTEQGKVLIKYGRPKNELKIRNVESLFVPREKLLNINSIETIRILENRGLSFNFWYYDSLSFVFSKPIFSGDENYNLAVWNDLNISEISEDEEKRIPEYYDYEPKGNKIEFPWNCTDFRGEDGRTRLEVAYGIPFNMVQFSQKADVYTNEFQSGVFLLDEEKEWKLKDIQDKNLNYYTSQIDTTSNDLAIEQSKYEVDPGRYYLGVEVKDKYSDNTGTYRDWIDIESYGYDSLQMSDILMAQDILFVGTGTITRDDLIITPSPHRYYRISQSLYIYYEIYNLFQNMETGRTSFILEYSLQSLEDQSIIKNFVRLLTLNDQIDQGVVISFQYNGDNPDENQFLRIDHNLNKPGVYLLKLKITDLLSGKSVEKSTDLRLFKDF